MTKKYRAVKVYGCIKCSKLYSPTIYAVREDLAREAAIQAAQRCCEPKSCKSCGGALDYPSYTACRPCREILKLHRAVEVEYKDCEEPVFSDDVQGSWGDGYSGDMQEFEESCDGEGVEPPCYVHPCTANKFQFDPDDIIDRVHDYHHEDAIHDLNDIKGLFAFFKEWNAKQNLRTFYPDYTKVVVLDRDRFDALLARVPST